MDVLGTVLTVIDLAGKMLPQIMATATDLKPFASALFTQLSGGAAPTDTELAALEAKIDELAARLQAPLPPAQPGDPDYVKPVDPAPVS